MNKQQTNLFACFLLSLLFYGPLGAQPKKACELTDVATINSILGTTLQYDANSIINKSGKYECRYTDPKSPGRYIAIGLLESKVAYGYDMLKTEFDTNQKMTSEGKKAGGKFTKFVAFSKAGANAYYMTGPKDDFSPEALTFKFRKGDYLLSFSTNDITNSSVIEKLDAVYTLFSSKL